MLFLKNSEPNNPRLFLTKKFQACSGQEWIEVMIPQPKYVQNFQRVLYLITIMNIMFYSLLVNGF